MAIDRRHFLKAASAATAGLWGCSPAIRPLGHVVVVGGGFGGATAAKYLRLWSEGRIAVTLVERNESLVSCPMSNLVVAGSRSLSDITVGYGSLRDRWGVRVVRDEVLAVEADKRHVILAGGGKLSYDRLVLSPGIDFLFDQIPGLDTAEAQSKVVHAWKAGPQTVTLRKQLESMPDGGVFAIAIPRAPFRCPPGPYERVCLVADYFKREKPKSKIVVLDANDEVVSKKALFMKAWADLYPGMIDYRPNSELKDVDPDNRTAVLEFDQFEADVLNAIPPQQAGRIAREAGLKLVNGRWVEVDWLTMESVNTPGVHVLGDALFPGPSMPKSGHMANQHGKLAAAAILNLLAGEAPNPTPVVMNTCFSFVDQRSAIHVATVHQYDAAARMMLPVKGAGGVSAARNEVEGKAVLAWARNIWADMLV